MHANKRHLSPYLTLQSKAINLKNESLRRLSPLPFHANFSVAPTVADVNRQNLLSINHNSTANNAKTIKPRIFCCAVPRSRTTFQLPIKNFSAQITHANNVLRREKNFDWWFSIFRSLKHTHKVLHTPNFFLPKWKKKDYLLLGCSNSEMEIAFASRWFMFDQIL